MKIRSPEKILMLMKINFFHIHIAVFLFQLCAFIFSGLGEFNKYFAQISRCCCQYCEHYLGDFIHERPADTRSLENTILKNLKKTLYL